MVMDSIDVLSLLRDSQDMNLLHLMFQGVHDHWHCER